MAHAPTGDAAQADAARPGVLLETYGCQMNVLDSELVQGQLRAMGYRIVDDVEDAGVVLINTCSVRELSEHKVWSRLGRLGQHKREAKPDLVVGVLGCMAEREGKGILARMPHVDLVCGPSNLDQVPSMIDNARRNLGQQLALAGHTSRRSATLEAATDGVAALDLSRAFAPEPDPSRQAYVRITRGCNKFCSFCVVPYTRGPEVHRPPAQIVDEVRRLADQGVKEVTLLGQTVNHYHHEDGGRSTSFAELLWHVHEGVPHLPRLRFVTSYPRDFGDDALDVMAQCPRICRYLHVPAQSGSNRVLKLMNRGYTVEEYEELLARARARLPDVRLAGDMIIGFPTESDADHAASMQLLRRARYKSAFIFKYSPRSGTQAERRLPDDVPEEIKKQRNLEMLELQRQTSLAHHQGLVGTTVEVLVESESTLRSQPKDLVQLGGGARGGSATTLVGRSGGDEIVIFDGPRRLIGELALVRVHAATAMSALGQLVGEATRARCADSSAARAPAHP